MGISLLVELLNYDGTVLKYKKENCFGPGGIEIKIDLTNINIPTPPIGTGTGLRGEYFSNNNFTDKR